MLYLLAQGFWFIVPAMYSNMAPVWAKKMPFLSALDIPIDSGRKFRGKPLFGRNKTYRGFAAGLLFALSVGASQYLISQTFPVFDRLEFFDLDLAGYLWLSALLGLGALLGDAGESFFKRQANVPPGHTWAPFDQIDYVIGALLLSLPIGALTAGGYLAVIVVGIFMHPVGTVVGWKLGLKDKPF